MKLQNENLIIEIENGAEGTIVKSIQEALILGIEKIGTSENADSEDHKNAVYWLSAILRATLLDASQTNVGLGKHAYKNLERKIS